MNYGSLIPGGGQAPPGGEAYSMCARVVERAITFNWGLPSTRDLSMHSAWMDKWLNERSSSRGLPIVRLAYRTTPRLAAVNNKRKE